MSPEDILKLTRAQPFRPFRIIMVSGKTYEVRHPEIIVVTYYSVMYFHMRDLDKPAESYDILGMSLIERIEFVEQPATV